MKVSVYEAKSKLSEMIKKAESGEEVIITRNGTETVRLVPVAKKKNWIGMWAGQVKIHDSFYDSLDDDETVKYLTGEIESRIFPDENID